MNDSQPRIAWRGAVIAIAALLLLVVSFYQQPVWYLLSRWNQLSAGDYGHGYLVLAISVYLVFHNRHTLLAQAPCPEYRAIFGVIAISLFWMVAALVDIAVLQAVALLFLILFVVWTLVGNRAIRVLAFPILYIGFAIPVWFPLSPLLQEITADVVFWAIRVLEVPAYRVENIIVLPSGRMSVQEACSGLRYLLAALTLGTLYAYLNYSTLTARLMVVLVFAGAAVLSNILRVFIVVYLAYTSDMQHPLVTDHLNLGWYLFAGLIVVLLVAEIVLLKKRGVMDTSANLTDRETTIIGDTDVPKNNCQRSMMISVAVLAGLVSLAPLSVYWLNNQNQSNSVTVPIVFPVSDGSWREVNEKDSWMPQYRGATAQKVTFIGKDKQKVYLYLGLYPVQRQGEELINDLNRISNNTLWSVKYQKAKLYNTGGQRVFEQLLEKNDGSQRLVWYWYRVAGQNTVSKYQAKVLQVLGLLQGDTRASVVAISSGLASRLDGEPDNTRNTLRQFADEMNDTINSVIDSENQAIAVMD